MCIIAFGTEAFPPKRCCALTLTLALSDACPTQAEVIDLARTASGTLSRLPNPAGLVLLSGQFGRNSMTPVLVWLCSFTDQ